eukprot:8143761-Pyramimonas_sp.AAC.1
MTAAENIPCGRPIERRRPVQLATPIPKPKSRFTGAAKGWLYRPNKSTTDGAGGGVARPDDERSGRSAG